MVSCVGMMAVSRRGMGTVPREVAGTVSCDILEITIASVFVGVGGLGFETFEPIRSVQVSRRRDDESRALLQHPQRSATTIGANKYHNRQLHRPPKSQPPERFHHRKPGAERHLA